MRSTILVHPKKKRTNLIITLTASTMQHALALVVPPCVVDRWAGGSLTRRPKGPFAVSWPRQLGE